MIYERKDKGCRAEILADDGETLLIRAFWPAKVTDPKYSIARGCAVNILNLRSDDFHSRYEKL